MQTLEDWQRSGGKESVTCKFTVVSQAVNTLVVSKNICKAMASIHPSKVPFRLDRMFTSAQLTY